MSCLLNWPKRWLSAIRTSSNRLYYPSNSLLRFCLWLYCTTEMKTKSMIETQTSDMICWSFGMNAVFRLATDHWGISRGSKLPSRTQHSSLLCGQLSSRMRHSSQGSTNHHVWGLSLDHLMMHPTLTKKSKMCTQAQQTIQQSAQTDQPQIRLTIVCHDHGAPRKR